MAKHGNGMKKWNACRNGGRMLEVKNVSYKIGKKQIINDVSLLVKDHEFVGIIGPNGSGKSTLLKTIYKMLPPSSGDILFNGQSLLNMKNKTMARSLAVVAQENGANFDFLVEEVIQMGRYPQKKMLENANDTDKAIVLHSLRMVGLEHVLGRSFLSLSGGEKQRIFIARALAQQTDMILLDEPTNHLDIGSQMKTLQLLKQSKKTILTALHDLGLAARFCDRIYVMYQGRIYAQGTPREVITPELVRTLYHLDAEIFDRRGNLCIDYL